MHITSDQIGHPNPFEEGRDLRSFKIFNILYFSLMFWYYKLVVLELEEDNMVFKVVSIILMSQGSKPICQEEKK